MIANEYFMPESKTDRPASITMTPSPTPYQRLKASGIKEHDPHFRLYHSFQCLLPYPDSTARKAPPQEAPRILRAYRRAHMTGSPLSPAHVLWCILIASV